MPEGGVGDLPLWELSQILPIQPDHVSGFARPISHPLPESYPTHYQVVISWQFSCSLYNGSKYEITGHIIWLQNQSLTHDLGYLERPQTRDCLARYPGISRLPFNVGCNKTSSVHRHKQWQWVTNSWNWIALSNVEIVHFEEYRIKQI